MLTNKVLRGKKVLLRDINLEDCNDTYYKWMNDVDTNRYMETRWSEQTTDSISSFVQSKRESSDSILFAIVIADKGIHIGNIKLGPIDVLNKRADISYFIGNKEFWGGGYTTEAISLVIKYSFEELRLHRLEAGVIDGNEASKAVLLKNGFELEGVFKEHSCMGTEVYSDVYRYGIVNRIV